MTITNVGTLNLWWQYCKETRIESRTRISAGLFSRSSVVISSVSNSRTSVYSQARIKHILGLQFSFDFYKFQILLLTTFQLVSFRLRCFGSTNFLDFFMLPGPKGTLKNNVFIVKTIRKEPLSPFLQPTTQGDIGAIDWNGVVLKACCSSSNRFFRNWTSFATLARVDIRLEIKYTLLLKPKDGILLRTPMKLRAIWNIDLLRCCSIQCLRFWCFEEADKFQPGLKKWYRTLRME